MNNIFEILQEEKNRILEMHENATKNQYLMEEIPSPYQQYSSIPDLSNLPAPKSKKVSSYTTKKWNQFSTSYSPTSSVTRGIAKGAVFVLSKNDNSIITAVTSIYYRKNDKWVIIGNKPLRISYYCKQGKFYIQNDEKVQYVSETLGKALNDNVCYYKKDADVNSGSKTPLGDTQLTDAQKLDKAKKCGHTSWNDYQKSNWSCKGKIQQQNIGNVSNLNKEIQQLIGNKEPNGQLSSEEINTIITKLG